MNGKTGFGNLPDVKVDANAGDIFSRLQFGALLYMEAANDHWAITSDLIYMNLKQDVKSGMVINSGKMDAKQFAWELAGLYKVIPWLELGLGGRLNSLKASLDLTINTFGGGTTATSNSVTRTWFDPIFIVRVKNSRGKKFIYNLRGDLGGFGIGSKFTWQLQAYAGYQVSKLFQITGGYRAIGLNYEKGNNEDYFLYNMDTFGPEVRLGFNF